MVEDEADQALAPVCYSQSDWTSLTSTSNDTPHPDRAGIRLKRPEFLGFPQEDLWNALDYDLWDTGTSCPVDGDDPSDRRNVLEWADGTPSGYAILNWSAAGPFMTCDVLVP